MKKSLAVFLTAIMSVSCLTSFAASGDVAGQIYSTDIVTFMYYAPITSYNIGGKTCIDAEILNWHYGFDVYWHEAERHLDITDKGGRFVSLQAMSGEIVENADVEKDEVIGDYYETDIVTTLNGQPIESYNIGGRTVICAEAMREHGYNVDWSEAERTLTISKPMDFYEYETDYGTIQSMDELKIPKTRHVFLNRGVIVSNGEKEYMLDIPSDKVYVEPSGMTYIKLSDFISIFGGECALERESETAVSEWVNGITDTYEYYKYTFNYTYDTLLTPDIYEYAPETYGEITREEITGNDDLYVVDLPVSFEVNGEETGVKAFWAGKEFSGSFRVIENEVYIPTYNVAVFGGYDYAY